MIAQTSDPRLEVRKLLPEKAKNYYARAGGAFATTPASRPIALFVELQGLLLRFVPLFMRSNICFVSRKEFFFSRAVII